MPNAFDANNPPFDRLTAPEMETLRKALDIGYYRPGETIVPPDAPAEALYVVIKGVVEERTGDEAIALLGPKDSFDSRALVHGHSGNAFVAREETLCYLLPKAVALDLVHANPRFAAFFYLELSRKLDALAREDEDSRVGTLMRARVRDMSLYPASFIEADDTNRILDFHEKNPDAPTITGHPDHVYASMGNYLFATRMLLKALRDDAEDENSTHDFGRDILPRLVRDKHPIYAYDFQTNKIPGEPSDMAAYWRDVGTIDAYWEANMDLRAILPALNLYNRQWPLRTSSYPDPPAKFTFDELNRRGEAVDSVVSGGCILSGGRVKGSILGRGVKVHAGAYVEDSVIMDNCDIGRRARVRRAILDKNVRVPEDATIGYDIERDRRLYHVTESGLVVVEGNRSPVDIATVFV